jgi:hypothetical protein
VAAAIPAFALLDIKDGEGTFVKRNKKINLKSFGDGFSTKNLQLAVGNYYLVQFMILDARDNVLFATPAEGSDLSKYVSDPLPINLSVTRNSTTIITPQVLDVSPEFHLKNLASELRFESGANATF